MWSLWEATVPPRENLFSLHNRILFPLAFCNSYFSIFWPFGTSLSIRYVITQRTQFMTLHTAIGIKIIVTLYSASCSTLIYSTYSAVFSCYLLSTSIYSHEHIPDINQITDSTVIHHLFDLLLNDSTTQCNCVVCEYLWVYLYYIISECSEFSAGPLGTCHIIVRCHR